MRLLLLLLIIPFFAISQTVKKQKTDLNVYLKTDINYASSAADNRKEAQSAVGTLGIKFDVYNNIWASSTFTVHSQNQEISTEDISETKLFGTNLLLPQNSSSDISNFELQTGINSIYRLVRDFREPEKICPEKKSHVFLSPLDYSSITILLIKHGLLLRVLFYYSSVQF